MVEVEILGCVITSQYGTLSAGTILTTDEAFARHLVDDCSAAKYLASRVVPDDVSAEVAAEAVIEPENKPRHKKQAD